MTVLEYLFLVGNLNLLQQEHLAAVQLAPVFFPGGTHTVDAARIRLAWLHHEAGIGAARWCASVTLRGLVDRGVLEPVREAPARERHTYRLRPPERWSWPSPERYTWARRQLETLRTPERAWGGRAEVVEVLAALFDGTQGVTACPADPDFEGWIRVVGALMTQFGRGPVEDAVTAVVFEPGLLVPFAPTTFRTLFFALVQRGRRQRVSSG